jgi:predicted NUDIX family phosphoesterase
MGMDEEVLCVRASLIDKLGAFTGFQRDVDRYLNALLDRDNQSFQPRRTCETDPSYKQLIPYVLLKCTDSNGTQLFQYTRGKGQGEKRLHALRSVGIGGHISTEDTQGDDWYRTGMARELEEEIVLPNPGQHPIVGLIYDDSNEVGKVHLGIVHVMELSGPDARAREDDLVDAGFLPLAEISKEIDRLETWSRLCVENLF